jgi:hypothetical protein
VRPAWSSFLVVTVAALALGCSKAGEESRTKRSPAAPPPASSEVPADLAIRVAVDGVAQPPIDAARLRAQPADFADTERRAWRLSSLVPAFDAPGRVIEAVGAGGMTLKFDRPATPAAPTPVLFLTRRGDVVVALVDPAQPFPDYHGQGGRLRRPGDAQPHLSPVTALLVTR